MYACPTALAAVTAVALTVSADRAPGFTLGASGAVTLSTSGAEVYYGRLPDKDGQGARISVSLGATNPDGSLILTLNAEDPPRPGTYAVTDDWRAAGPAFHAALVAGSVNLPLGWFEGVAGTVTVTDTADGVLSGKFEVRGRGWLRNNPGDENRWVTVRGRFHAMPAGGSGGNLTP